MTPRDYTDYLRDMLDSIEKIEVFTKGLSAEQFAGDEKTIFAVIRALEVLGEASRKIPEAVKARYADVPWRDVAAIRNKLIHEYFGVSHAVVWRTIQDDLPRLKPVLAQALRDAA